VTAIVGQQDAVRLFVGLPSSSKLAAGRAKLPETDEILKRLRTGLDLLVGVGPDEPWGPTRRGCQLGCLH
jgi:hypothetical protein